MKATDLMIGDWVIAEEKVVQILILGSKRAGVAYGSDTAYYYDELQPIPLTPEILEKKGFKDFSGGGYIIKELSDDEIPTLYVWQNNSIYVVDYYSTNKYTYIKECKYVHELEHILKFNGVNKEIVL